MLIDVQLYKQLLEQVNACEEWLIRAMLSVVTATMMLRALAEPNRQAILRLIRDQPRPASEIASHFEITQQAVSQHLHVLEQAQLVSVLPQGRQRVYAVRPDGLATVQSFLADLWPAGLERLKTVVEADTSRPSDDG